MNAHQDKEPPHCVRHRRDDLVIDCYFYKQDRSVSHSFKILNWSALAGNLQTKEDWLKWSQSPWVPREVPTTPSPFIPKNMKRRCSHLSRLALSVALEISQEALPNYSVFASRHGEIGRTLSLLEDIYKKQPLSPTAFSQSVHNTACGLYTIAHQARLRSTSLSAGKNTAKMAFVEAYNEILKNPQHSVQITVFDQKLPPRYQASMTLETFDFAFSLIIAQGPELSDSEPHEALRCDRNRQNEVQKYPELRLMEILSQSTPAAHFPWNQVLDIL